MYIRIRQHVENLFKSVPINESTLELKEEIIANSTEKYDDLIASGLDEEAALAKVISGIGNINELLGTESEEDEITQKERKKSALLISVAVGLYILALIPVMIIDEISGLSILTESIGAAMMFAIWAVATTMVVFGASIKPNKYGVKSPVEKKSSLLRSVAIGMYVFSLVPVIILTEFNVMFGTILMFLLAGVATIMLVYLSVSKPKNVNTETVVEEFKQWQQEKKQNPICKTIQSIVWCVAVIIYLVVSFYFSAWPFSWLIFIITAIVTQIIKLCFDLFE